MIKKINDKIEEYNLFNCINTISYKYDAKQNCGMYCLIQIVITHSLVSNTNK